MQNWTISDLYTDEKYKHSCNSKAFLSQLKTFMKKSMQKKSPLKTGVFNFPGKQNFKFLRKIKFLSNIMIFVELRFLQKLPN